MGHRELRLYDCTSESLPFPPSPFSLVSLSLEKGRASEILKISGFDCPHKTTDVRDTELASISIFCPHLERLTLNLCGRLDDDVLTQWEKGFDELKHLALYAPYLVTPGKWKEFFEKRHEKGFEFETFQLRMSSRKVFSFPLPFFFSPPTSLSPFQVN